MKKNAQRATHVLWIARIAVLLVFILNVQCALSFIFVPWNFTDSFELSGVAGQAAIRGLGVAFLMWNATYPAVIINPLRFQNLFVVVLIQQLVGLIGESVIRAFLPVGHALLASSIERFVLFDGVGMALMAGSFALLLRHRR